MAAKAAGTKVVAVPSLPKQTHLYTSADEVINSLLDIRPEKWGLPPFQDCKKTFANFSQYSFSFILFHLGKKTFKPCTLQFCRDREHFTN